MVTINKIYTRTGDDGSTGLVGGERIAKNSDRVSAYGDVDELNSCVGLARTESLESGDHEMAALLEVIQHRLFDIGAELACPRGELFPGMTPFSSAHATALENAIDETTEGVPVLKSFVLPGGSRLNSALHIARAVARRAERTVLDLAAKEPVSREICIYINRLSDLLFALARRACHDQGKPEFLWAQKK
jgi:cob(I)alamin adenosyltransferase